MKYRLYLACSLLCALMGYGLMWWLLEGEGKLSRPGAAGELWAGTAAFTVFGVILGLIAVKVYPYNVNSAEYRFKAGTITVGVTAVMGLLNAGFLQTFFGAGWVDRETFAPPLMAFNLLVGLAVVFLDSGVARARASAAEHEQDRADEDLAHVETMVKRITSEGDWSEAEKDELRLKFREGRSE